MKESVNIRAMAAEYAARHVLLDDGSDVQQAIVEHIRHEARVAWIDGYSAGLEQARKVIAANYAANPEKNQ